ncbi:MAG: hypothetical protein FD129_821 [bacterium]|nr:MAG: hypothetical protein FD129_821 [bacterium]
MKLGDVTREAGVTFLMFLCMILQPRMSAAQGLYFHLSNPYAEDGPVSPNGNTIVAVPGWTTTGSLTVVAYGTPGPFPIEPDDGAVGDSKFFCGGPGDTLSTATQLVTLTEAEWTELSLVHDWVLVITADMGGWASDDAIPSIEVTMLDLNMSVLDMHTLTPTSGTISHYANTSVIGAWGTYPPSFGVRFVRVTIRLRGLPGEYNSSMVDDVQVAALYPDPIESTTWSRLKRGLLDP